MGLSTINQAASIQINLFKAGQLKCILEKKCFLPFSTNAFAQTG